ncbi:hypothetical protein BHE74_00055062 [Ensete ventricosum]|nr:hypothetical protein BHE74_00055062 [Ensete ventricosum]
MRLGIRLEYIGSLPRWCKGVRRKKTETRWKIIGGIRKIARNKPGDRRRKTVRLAAGNVGDCRITGMMGQDQAWASGRVQTMRWNLAESSLGDSPKGSGSSLGTYREIAGRRPYDSSQECRRLPD